MEKKNIFVKTVKVEKKDFDEAIKNAFLKKQKDIKLDGFRKGKVPFEIYIKKYGKESLYMDAVDMVLPDAYKKAIESDKLVPIIEPKVDIKSIDENGVEFIFTITTMPEVNIKKYKKLGVKKQEAKVTDEEVEEEIKKMLERYSELVIKDFGEVENHDTAIIDFEGFKDGVAFSGGKGENYALEIGSNTFIPGFEEQIIGMKKGEEKDINVTFPKDYQSQELKGAKATFKVKVNEIKTKVERKLDEEFFEDLGLEGVNSKETLQEEVKKNILARKESDSENEYIDNLLAKVAEQTEVDIPEELIDDETHHMIHRFEEQLRMQGISLEVYQEITKTTHEDMHKQMEPEAKKHILYRFILETIIEKENITVTDKEADDFASDIAKRYGMEKDEFIKSYGGIEALKYEVSIKKVIDFLKENN